MAKMAGAEDDSEALAATICKDYAEGRITLTPDWLVETVADYISSVDADECVKFRDAVRVYPRRGAAGRLKVCSSGSKSSSRLDSARRPICRTRALGGISKCSKWLSAGYTRAS